MTTSVSGCHAHEFKPEDSTVRGRWYLAITRFILTGQLHTFGNKHVKVWFSIYCRVCPLPHFPCRKCGTIYYVYYYHIARTFQNETRHPVLITWWISYRKLTGHIETLNFALGLEMVSLPHQRQSSGRRDVHLCRQVRSRTVLLSGREIVRRRLGPGRFERGRKSQEPR